MPILPERANVSFFVPLDAASLAIATYERGVGLTASCGTAMAAGVMGVGRLRRVPPLPRVQVR